MLQLILILLFVVVLSFYVKWKNRRFVISSKQFSGSLNNVPVFGSAHLFAGSDEDRMTTFKIIGKDSLKHGGVSYMWIMHKLFINVADAEIAEFLLKSCLEKEEMIRFLRELVGNGSIFAPVPIWRPRRKVLAPVFSQKNLQQFAKIFSEQSKILIHQLRPNVGDEPFSLWQYLTTYTLDSVCLTTLGVNIHAQYNPNQPFLKAFEKIIYMIATRMCQPWIHNDTVYKLLGYRTEFEKHKKVAWDFVDKVIKDKRKEMIEQVNAKSDNKYKEDDTKLQFKTFLEMLIESSGGEKGYTDMELQEELLVIVSAGTDTSAVGAAFTCTMLSKYPEVQEKLYDEVKEVFKDDPDRDIGAKDLPKLKYLDAVIRETLRYYPPGPVIVREVENDVMLPSGETLIKGTSVLVNIWGIHRNPKYWGPDADVFRPERFLDTPLKHPAQFIAFSHGPRGCIGYQYAMMSMKTAVASIVRNFKILPKSDTNVEDFRTKPLRIKFGIMMKDVDNFEVRFESRKKINRC